MPDATRGRDLTEEDWQKLHRFRGYGNPAGRFWFIGIEERGDGIIQELRVRLKFQEVEDLLYSQSPEVWGHSKLWKDFNPDKLIPTWSAMIRFVLRLSGDAEWKDPERVRKYQKESLGKLDGQTFLADILRCPSHQMRPGRTFGRIAIGMLMQTRCCSSASKCLPTLSRPTRPITCSATARVIGHTSKDSCQTPSSNNRWRPVRNGSVRHYYTCSDAVFLAANRNGGWTNRVPIGIAVGHSKLGL